MYNIDLYTDGACSGNPGPGGWGAVLICGDIEKQISGYCENTTNNRMELTAVIEGLGSIKHKSIVTIYTDSAYVYNAYSQNWINSWINNGWKTSNKKDVSNVDLWVMLNNLINKHTVNWVKVKGHADNKYNNICDKLATGEISKKRETL